jgi:hypothetical protein
MSLRLVTLSTSMHKSLKLLWVWQALSVALPTTTLAMEVASQIQGLLLCLVWLLLHPLLNNSKGMVHPKMVVGTVDLLNMELMEHPHPTRTVPRHPTRMAAFLLAIMELLLVLMVHLHLTPTVLPLELLVVDMDIQTYNSKTMLTAVVEVELQ